MSSTTIPVLYDLFLASSGANTDTRQIKPNQLFFALKGQNFDGNSYAKKALEEGALAVVVDDEKLRNADKQIYYTENVLNTLQQLSNYHRKKLNASIIGLTGSNGKTTSKELIASVLAQKYKVQFTQGNLNNHIGVPLSLLSIKPDTQIAVIEMGANHQKEIELLSSICEPDIGYITNFGLAHLEGFGGFEGVVKGKTELYEYLKKSGKTVLVNLDDPIQQEKSNGIEKRLEFSTSIPSNVYVKELFTDLAHKDYVSVDFQGQHIQSKLTGGYNVSNIAAAIALGVYFDVSPYQIKAGIENYQPENSRSQIMLKDGKKIVLDAYNANPSSMEVAIKNFLRFHGTKTIFLGDMFELGASSALQHQKIIDLLLGNIEELEEVYLVGENFSDAKNSHEKIKRFYTLENLLDDLALKKINSKNLLIKGSRGMTMEKVIDFI